MTVNDFTIDDDNRDFITTLSSFRDNQDWTNILILGGVGVGKTYCSRKIFPEAYFVSEATFKQHLSSGILKLCPPDKRESKSAYLLEMLPCKGLVIYDDIGVADITEAYVDKMIYWLDARLAKGKKTIFTSNLTLAELEAREKRIASRLLQHCKVLVLGGEDRRKMSKEVFTF